MVNKNTMIECPACSQNTLHPKRKELGFHVCVNCSSTDKVVGITTVEGTGDHTWNDIIIMDRKKAIRIAQKEAEITGRKVEIDIEVQDYEKDEEAISQSANEAITKSLSESQQDQSYDVFDPNKQFEGIQGIDY
tara:strand:+ start:584 stop:985 length:402 start_codon:yes stop_codon:yes gene_type:complete